MNNSFLKTTIGALSLAGLGISNLQAHNSGDWCASLKSIGTIYKDKSNPYIQEFKVFGRFQGQLAYIDGEGEDGEKFNATFDEIRRLRVGAQVKFLNGFKLKANLNLEDDDHPTGGTRKLGYQNFDQAKISYTLKDFAGFDEASLTYGRHKVEVGREVHTSSKEIKTVERSAIANKISPERATGVTLDLERGSWAGTLGVFSTEDPEDFIGGWGAGQAIYLSNSFNTGNGELLIDFIYDLDQDKNEGVMPYEWATSVAYTTKLGDWEFMANAIVGDNGQQSNADREGMFYGLVVMPSRFLVDDKLEFVARYTYMGSEEEEGVRTNSRYFRRDNGGDVNSGRGNSHHSIYAGLNWYQCGHNSKVMTGIEYETLETPDDTASAATLWLAYRMYF